MGAQGRSGPGETLIWLATIMFPCGIVVTILSVSPTERALVVTRTAEILDSESNTASGVME